MTFSSVSESDDSDDESFVSGRFLMGVRGMMVSWLFVRRVLFAGKVFF